jgi:lipopolysaccharide export system protein LptA
LIYLLKHTGFLVLCLTLSLLRTPLLLDAQPPQKDTVTLDVKPSQKDSVALDAQPPQKDTVTLDVQPQDSVVQPVKKRIKIINSDLTHLIETDSGQMSHMKGNVEMEHNKAILNCDSAIMYPNNFFEAMGHAQITSGTTTVSGDFMTYDGKTAIVWGTITYLIDSTATLRTAKVIFDTETEIGQFDSDGTIVDSSRLIEAQKGYYHSKTKEFEFFGAVEADAKTYVLRSDSMRYNTNTKIFLFSTRTHIWTDDGYLYADRGWYDSHNDLMFFYENSYILSSQQEIFADSVYYESLVKKGKLYSRVQIVDTAQQVIALTDFADFDMNTEDFLMQDNSSVITFDDKDTTYMRADTIISVKIIRFPPDSLTNDSINSGIDSVQVKTSTTKDSASLATTDTTNIVADTAKFAQSDSLSLATTDSLGSATTDSLSLATDSLAVVPLDSVYKELFAYRNVKLYRKDFQLMCDSLYFNDSDSIWKAYKNPIVWNGRKMQIHSDSMKFIIKKGELHQAVFSGKAMIITPVGNNLDSVRYYNQIKAKNIDVFFHNQRVSRLDGEGNLQTIAFSMADFSVNKHEAASVKMLFDSTENLRFLSYYTDVTGFNKPIILVKENEIKLDGLDPKFDRRPTSGAEVVNRIIRPSERSSREKIRKPAFPITTRFNDIEQILYLNNSDDLLDKKEDENDL